MTSWTHEYYQRRQRILDECEAGMKRGEVEYAENDMTASKQNLTERDMITELIEERRDAINYEIGIIIQLEELRDKMRNMT